ncbi:MAG: hypothetical protein COV67_01430 [Nitrospinae bacterium CG11_big_fil_rev_8_21_14_0_20_56_8]|nr:MAG: hypothetical protein COV67_01430 [Nitrospinae bacterium CG11_big_fil_rev_8_21_14_0_20_56_8]
MPNRPFLGLPSKKLVMSLGFIAFLLSTSPLMAQDPICKNGLRDLKGSFDVLQGRGGIWAYLEQTPGLRDSSMLGLQVDGKLQRLIVVLETMCKDGKTPTMESFNGIQSLIGDARVLFNLNTDKTTSEEILTKVKAIIKSSDDLLASLGQ